MITDTGNVMVIDMQEVINSFRVQWIVSLQACKSIQKNITSFMRPKLEVINFHT